MENPEQSNPRGEEPPDLYGVPIKERAVSTSLFLSIERLESFL
jgi:hypothetical protein